MRKAFLKIAILFGLAASLVFGQTAHSVALTWTDTANPAGTTYSIYRATGQCTGSLTFTKISAAPVAAKTYTDNSVQPGPYCYVATATFNAIESGYSNSALAAVPTSPPNSLTITTIQ
jgi:hypothetical protein